MNTRSPVARPLLIVVALFGAGGVALGAWGAHGLESHLAERGYEATLIPKRLQQFDTGVRYHLLHVVALLALAALPVGRSAPRTAAVILFVIGISLFAGSLYALVLSNQTRFGMVTPLGGLCLIVGWLCCLAIRPAASATDP